jgi:polysaccharide pyruvyl transferase WcaK-like protein
MTLRDRPEGGRSPIAALLSPCGTGNLGDAAIQDSILHHVRRILPLARFVGITLCPMDTEIRHGIPGFPIDVLQRGMPYGVEAGTIAEAELNRFPATIHDLRVRAQALTVSREFLSDSRVSRLRRIMRRLKRESQHFMLALALLRNVDVLVISGGGQIDDLWGGAGQHPFALFKWTLAARIRRRPILMVSVGSGRLRSASSRWLVRRTLMRVGYATCRDRHSARVVGTLGSRRVEVVPDLALSYPAAALAGPPSGAESALRLGIAPMAFGDSRFWPENMAQQFSHYIESLTQLACRMAESGTSITMFSTTPSDAQVAKELYATVLARLPAKVRPNLVLTVPKTVKSLTEALQTMDVVVASRLHAVILATDCMRPVVAIACEWKVERFLFDLDLSRYCHRFAAILPDELYETVVALVADHGRVAARMEAFRKQAEAKLEPEHQIVAQVLAGGPVPAVRTSQRP